MPNVWGLNMSEADTIYYSASSHPGPTPCPYPSVEEAWLKDGSILHVVTSGDSVRSLGLPLRLEGRGRRLCPLTLVDTLEYLSSSSRESSEPWFRSSSTCLLDVFVACADGYTIYMCISRVHTMTGAV